LPFKYTGSSEDLKALAEGLSEEIITGLSRFSYLRVIARGSTAKYSSELGDVRTIGKELGARYVMEGSLRQAGSNLRLAVQLADTVSGAHLWAETYERAFTSESVFEVQGDLVPRIVSTVADQYGILTRSMSETLHSKSEESLTPHEAVLRAFSYFARLTPEEHATVRRILERVVRQTPEQADCWAMLAMMYIVEYSDSYNALPNPLERALAAAQRAVDLAPSDALGHYALAWVYFFHREKSSLHAAVERAVALNPMDGSVIGMLGMLLEHAGESERGCHMVEKAMQMNPNYPGVLRFTAFTHAYCQGKYAEALEAAVRINMPASSMPRQRWLPRLDSSANARPRGKRRRRCLLCVLILPPWRAGSTPNGMTPRISSILSTASAKRGWRYRRAHDGHTGSNLALGTQFTALDGVIIAASMSSCAAKRSSLML
jgi:TolB-like protein